MLHYLPGCDVRNNHPKEIEKLTAYMKRQNAIIDVCCRVKEKFLDEGDIIIQNCTLCELLLKESHCDNECLSIYEYILNYQYQFFYFQLQYLLLVLLQFP